MYLLNRSLLVVIFGMVVLAQCSVPVSMIMQREAALQSGTEYHFRTRPVDPYDAFRGRYVALGFTNNVVAVSNVAAYSRGQRLFVQLETDADGFARLGEVSKKRPDAGGYLKVRVQYVYEGKVTLALPFDRFYMNEQDAPTAEAAYNTVGRNGEKPAYAKVRVRRGSAVIEDLFVDDISIGELLKKQSAPSK